MNRKLQRQIEDILPSIVELRQDLHAHPELGFEEHRTSAKVVERLESCGLEARQVAGTGVIGELKGDSEGPIFALRADMDCLPIQEKTGLPYASRFAGKMHACGHDGHTAVLVGAAQVMARMRKDLRGTVRFIFQPSEENVQGAKRMIEEGAMDEVDGILALHDWNDTEPGHISLKAGPIMASADTFTLTIQGQGGHGAAPHLTVDPILVASHLVIGLQSLVSREVSPTEAIVVTVGAFHAGTTDNVIPTEARLMGTVRTLAPALREAMPERLERIIEGVCRAFRADFSLEYVFGCGVTFNERSLTELVAETAAETLGEQYVHFYRDPSMGGEDFSEYLKFAPGMMFRLGIGGTEPIHSPRFDFNDRAIPAGIAVFVETTKRFLERFTHEDDPFQSDD